MRVRFTKTLFCAGIPVLACAIFATSSAGREYGRAAAATATVWDKVYTEEQATRGQASYMQACASCHRQDLTGSGNAPSLSGDDFSFQWNDRTVGELVERIRKLMPPTAPDSLPAAVYSDIVAFILQANQFPPGETPLPVELDRLKEIMITAKP